MRSQVSSPGHGDTIAIAGAAGGLGTAICESLAREGWSLLLGYHQSADRTVALRDRLRKQGTRAEVNAVDLRNPDTVAAFLLSDAAGYINGQIIGIDGGYSA